MSDCRPLVVGGCSARQNWVDFFSGYSSGTASVARPFRVASARLKLEEAPLETSRYVLCSCDFRDHRPLQQNVLHYYVQINT